jgi:hypothetical protein
MCLFWSCWHVILWVLISGAWVITAASHPRVTGSMQGQQALITQQWLALFLGNTWEAIREPWRGTRDERGTRDSGCWAVSNAI